jgi:hypothetical protein
MLSSNKFGIGMPLTEVCLQAPLTAAAGVCFQTLFDQDALLGEAKTVPTSDSFKAFRFVRAFSFCSTKAATERKASGV